MGGTTPNLHLIRLKGKASKCAQFILDVPPGWISNGSICEDVPSQLARRFRALLVIKKVNFRMMLGNYDILFKNFHYYTEKSLYCGIRLIMNSVYMSLCNYCTAVVSKSYLMYLRTILLYHGLC